MRASTLIRHVREGVKNVGRNGWMSVASISSITVSLFILGVFMLLALNVNKVADQIESKVGIRVYLQVTADQAKIQEVERSIKRMPEVKSAKFVSKEEGLKQLRESMGAEGKAALEGYTNDNNPLPDAFEIEVFEPQKVAFVAKKVMALNETDPSKPISDVRYGKGTIEKLFRITNAVRNIGMIIVAGLALMAMFLISTTIKMTIIARTREISIMKMVGATNSFIRWPFFIEGVLIGIIGSAITAGVLLFGYSKLITNTQSDIGLYMVQLVTVKDVGWIVAGSIVTIGALLGIWGSTISVRKYLKV